MLSNPPGACLRVHCPSEAIKSSNGKNNTAYYSLCARVGFLINASSSVREVLLLLSFYSHGN